MAAGSLPPACLEDICQRAGGHAALALTETCKSYHARIAGNAALWARLYEREYGTPGREAEYRVRENDGHWRRLFVAHARTAHRWANGKPLGARTWTGHEGSVNAAVVVPGGDSAVTAAADSTIRVWGRASGRWVSVITDVGSAVTSLGATRGYVVAGARDRTVRIWKLGRSVESIDGHEALATYTPAPAGRRRGPVNGIAIFGGDTQPAPPRSAANALGAAFGGGKAAAYRLDPNAPPNERRTDQARPPNAVAAVFATGEVSIWHVNSTGAHADEQSVGEHDGAAYGICVTGDPCDGSSPRGAGPGGVDSLLATCSANRTVRLWDPRAPGAAVLVLEGHADGALCVASGGGMRLVSGGMEGGVAMYDLLAAADTADNVGHTKACLARLMAPDAMRDADAWEADWVKDLAVCQYTGRIAAVHKSSSLRVWPGWWTDSARRHADDPSIFDEQGGRPGERPIFSQLDAGARCVALDERGIVAGANGGGVQAWDFTQSYEE